MPKRAIPIHTGSLYHVYNHSIDNTNTFTHKYHFQKAIEGLWYYRYQKPSIRLAYFKNLNPESKEKYLRELRTNPLLVDIVAFVILSDHFHLIIKQHIDGGTSRFMANMQNSYTRYFNAHKNRTGPLFDRQFKALPIDNKDDLLNLSKYLHLKPFTEKKVNNLEELGQYPWSSLPEYYETKPEVLRFCNRDPVMKHFKDVHRYRHFITDLDTLPQITDSLTRLLLPTK
jgi:REP element-mobilizing transposase RayT